MHTACIIQDKELNTILTGRKTSKTNNGLLPAFSYPPVCYALLRPIKYAIVKDKSNVFLLFRQFMLIYFKIGQEVQLRHLFKW